MYIVSGAIDALESAISDKGLVLERTLDAAHCSGDRVLLMSLVRNVVENAVRHNTAGGALSARTGEGAGAAWIEIENDGEPIAAERLPQLFEPFTRLRRIAGADRGSGLGLAIVQTVAVAHDGHVVAEPRSGGGLRVRVELPRPAGVAGVVAEDVALRFGRGTRAAVSG